MRKHYLDHVRWATVVTVVIYHVFYMYNAQGIAGGLGKITSLREQYYDVFMYIVYPWMMPILFVVSGISSWLYLEKHTEQEYFKSRTLKLLVPSTIGLFVFQFVQGYLSMSLSNAFVSFNGVPGFVLYLIMVLSGIGVLWYVQILWLFSVMLIWVRKIEKGRCWNIGKKVNLAVLFLLSVPVWMSAQFGNTPLIIVYRFGLYSTMFFLGYFVFSHDEVIEILKKHFPLIALIATMLCIAFSVSYFGMNIADAPINRSILFAAYCWFGTLAILGGTAEFFDFENRFTRWMNRNSFGLYVFHYLGISAAALFVAKPGILPPLAAYFLSLVAGFTVGFGLGFIISRIPFLRWAVLGMNKKG